jgi:hypothetical protein
MMVYLIETTMLVVYSSKTRTDYVDAQDKPNDYSNLARCSDETTTVDPVLAQNYESYADILSSALILSCMINAIAIIYAGWLVYYFKRVA